MSELSTTALLKSHANELVKQYIVYDGQSRVFQVYTAVASTADQEPCLVTEYSYVGPVSTQIQARKEYNGVWSSAYDF